MWLELCFGKYGDSMWNELELIEIDCRKVSCKVVVFREVIRFWVMVKIGIDRRDIIEFVLIE